MTAGSLEHWSPRPRPQRRALEGERVTLDPIDPELHAVSLFAAGHDDDGDPDLWRYMWVGPFDCDDFAGYLETCAASDDPLFYAIVVEGCPQGMCSFMRIAEEHGVVEIGHIWFGAALQRTAAATEAIFVLARHAFDDLGYRRLEWKCDAGNGRSMRAAERFGFRYEGTFRQHLVVKGRNRDTAWWSIVDGDWPRVRGAFEAWLAPANFDAAGRQRATLEQLRDDH